ncbi:MAG: PAN domain-containing protein, partial [Schleiferiaceae bacterium]
SDKANSFYKCAMKCCKNPYCATFDWNKRSKKCYQYNENIGSDDLEYYDSAPGWQMGALTYKNGYSYI